MIKCRFIYRFNGQDKPDKNKEGKLNCLPKVGETINFSEKIEPYIVNEVVHLIDVKNNEHTSVVYFHKEG